MSLAPLPALACDCHTHVIGPRDAWPMVGDRQYTPGPAPQAALQAHMDGLGLQRVVIVQPSVYGTDNRCMLDAMALFAGRARGVAVVDDDLDADGLAALHAAGVRGLRINHESSGKADPAGLLSALAAAAARVAPLGWHLQVYAGLDTIALAAGELSGLGVPVVLDHFAMVPAGTPADDPRLQAVLKLLRAGTAYVKLSAPYRIAGTGESAAAASALARRFIQANPNRVLWGSDWPHTNREVDKGPLETSAYRDIAPASLAAQLRDWPAGAQEREALLVANPALLYDFT